MPEAPTKREIERKATWLLAYVQAPGFAEMAVIVADFTALGARLVAPGKVPDAFELHVPQEDVRFRALVRWRRDDEVGVAFDVTGRNDL